MRKLLFVDACVRGQSSRTLRLCETFIDVFQGKNRDLQVERVELINDNIGPMTAPVLQEREKLIRDEKWNHSMFSLAKQFRNADYIVIGAPYWDLSFPAVLKMYLENVAVPNLTFEITDKGFRGLCDAERMFYITTAGGLIGDRNYGYDYICGMAEMLGIHDVDLIRAEALDMDGFDSEKIVARVIKEIKEKY